MAILLIGLIILLCGLGYGLLKPHRRARLSSSPQFTEQPTFDGLFAEQRAEEVRQLAHAEAHERAAKDRNSLLMRAGQGDLSTLNEAAARNDAKLYGETLQALLAAMQSEPQALADYIIASGSLRANARLVESLIDRALDAKSIARLLYIAALSDDVAIYERAAHIALRGWRENRIAAADLRALLESSYWLFAPEIRTANFSLQQLMAALRRALAAAHESSTQTRADRARP